MPGFKCQSKVFLFTLRVGYALGVFTLLSLLYVSASAQSLPSCAWRLETDGTGITNVAYPDTDATYWTMPVDTSQYPQVILQGQYPQSRFFSFTTYVAGGASVDATLDVNINPDPGSSNPFQQTPPLTQHNYSWHGFSIASTYRTRD